MRSSSRHAARRGFWMAIAFILLAFGFQGCATEAEGVMPWATPLPGEGSVILPGSLMRP
jgi:hypothetical protein